VGVFVILQLLTIVKDSKPELGVSCSGEKTRLTINYHINNHL
jgi:hypothetical protein